MHDKFRGDRRSLILKSEVMIKRDQSREQFWDEPSEKTKSQEFILCRHRLFSAIVAREEDATVPVSHFVLE